MKIFTKKRLPPGQVIALGFSLVIFLGSVLLYVSNHYTETPMSFIDALFMSTSSVCVTGLSTVDVATSFSAWAKFVLIILMQMGGLGITFIGVGLMVVSRKKINIRERFLVKETLNMQSITGIVPVIKSAFIVTFIFELIGTILNLLVFARDFPFMKALSLSVFHAISSFNNCGLDIISSSSLSAYSNNIFLNITTMVLIIFGGIGFFVIKDITKNHSLKKVSLHTKTVISTTLTLLIFGTIIIRLTSNSANWLESMFISTSSRTAGFFTCDIGKFSNAGLFAVMVLMFIGASPGSTGGGIKTTTFFVLIRAVLSEFRREEPSAYHRKIPQIIVKKAFIVTLLAGAVIVLSTFTLCILEPNIALHKLLFESVSAFATVGLSTGVTSSLGTLSKIVLIITMFIGRIGPITVVSFVILPYNSGAFLPEESVNVG